MSDTNKVKPEEVRGSVSLPSIPPITINSKAVGNNKSEKTPEQFIKSLKEASKKALFPPMLNQNGN